MDAYQWFGVVSAILVFVFAIYKWLVSRGDNLRKAVNQAQDKNIQEHSDRLDRHSQRLSSQYDLIQAIREDISKNYIRLEQIEKIEDQIEKLEEAIEQKLDKLNVRVGGISRELSETVGAIKTSHESQLTHLIEDIKDVLEKKGG